MLIISPSLWGAADQNTRDRLVQALAAQKGCAYDSNPYHARVEIRAPRSNRLIASGPPWNIVDE